MRRYWFWLALGAALLAGGLEAQVTPVIQSAFSNVSSARLSSSGTAPTCSSTGLGTGSAAIDAGSTDMGGSCTLSPTGAPSASGTMTLTFTSAYGGNAGPACVLLLQRGTGNWDARGTVRGNAVSTTAPTFLWDNNAVALAAGSTYILTYVCIGR